MRALWVLIGALAALAAIEGCKRKEPEPIPGPKAGPAVVQHIRTPGIAWFQGSLDEGFARADPRKRGPQNVLRCAAPARPVPRA